MSRDIRLLALLVLTTFTACCESQPFGKKTELNDAALVLNAIALAYSGGHTISVDEVTEVCSNCGVPSVSDRCPNASVTSV
jgi:hypothetical protein